jgi:hypothetical protein
VSSSETTSFSARLDARLVERLKKRSSREGISASQLAERYIEEGLRMEEFPGVEFRDGPAGRRASISGGPDVWEVVRDVHGAREHGVTDALAHVCAMSDLTEGQVRLALAYYAEHPESVDAFIAENDELTARLLAAFG